MISPVLQLELLFSCTGCDFRNHWKNEGGRISTNFIVLLAKTVTSFVDHNRADIIRELNSSADVCNLTVPEWLTVQYVSNEGLILAPRRKFERNVRGVDSWSVCIQVFQFWQDLLQITYSKELLRNSCCAVGAWITASSSK